VDAAEAYVNAEIAKSVKGGGTCDRKTIERLRARTRVFYYSDWLELLIG
jgi:hypothetical protein